jgi:hypothetical protein
MGKGSNNGIKYVDRINILNLFEELIERDRTLTGF